MDIIDCKTQFRQHHRYAYDNDRHNNRGADITIDTLEASPESDPLTHLLTCEEYLTNERNYTSFAALSKDLDTLINNEL